MGKKYKKYRNFLEKFLDGERGKSFFQKAYGIGGAIVLFGAMAKVLHWPAGDLIFAIGMTTEVIVFIISAFEKPDKNYKWEEVYPVLADDENFLPKAEREGISATGKQQAPAGPAIQSTAVPSSYGGGKTAASGQASTGGGNVAAGVSGGSAGVSVGGGGVSGGYAGGGGSGSGTIVVGGGGGTASGGDSSGVAGGSGNAGGGGLPGNITIVGGGGGVSGGGSISGGSGGTGNVSATPEDIAALSENVEQFSQISNSLNKISETLSKSFQTILENSEGIGQNTQGYISQMEALNRNLAGLNTIYEVQLKGISGQIGTIEHINAGLDRIKKLYDGSLADSSIFKNETEKMAQQLGELNRVYARLLEAMTTNMNMGGFGGGAGQGNTPPQQP